MDKERLETIRENYKGWDYKADEKVIHELLEYVATLEANLAASQGVTVAANYANSAMLSELAMLSGNSAGEEPNLDEITARCVAATPGPWLGDRDDGTVKYAVRTGDLEYAKTDWEAEGVVLRVDHKNMHYGFVGHRSEEDEAFVLHARTDVPALVALALKNKAEIKRLRSEITLALEYVTTARPTLCTQVLNDALMGVTYE